MKEFIGETGGRFLYIDDINLLQELSTSMLSIYNEFGNFIFSGCTPSANKISSGYIMLGGKLRKFNETPITKYPVYICEQNKTETVDYKNEQSKVGRIDYGCNVLYEKPTGIDDITKKDKVFLEITSADSRYLPNIKNVVIAKYAVLSSPSSNKQNIDGNTTFSGDTGFKRNVSIEGDLISGGLSSKRFLVQTSLDRWTMYLSSGQSRQTVLTAYQDNKIEFSSGSKTIVFDNGKITANSAVIGDIVIQEGSINTKTNSLKINNNRGNLCKIELFDGVSQIPVLVVDGNEDEIKTIKNLRTGSVLKIQDKNNIVSEDTFNSSVLFIDKDDVKIGEILAVKDSFKISTDQKEICISANKNNGSVKLNGTVFINDKEIKNMFVNQEDYDKLKETLVYSDGIKGLSDENYTKKEKDKLAKISTSTIKSNGDGYVTAKDAKTYTDSMVDKNKLLSDLVIEDNDAKKQICNTIGAAISSETQGKIKNTGWVNMLHHTGGDLYTLKVKQYGDVVHIAGTINTSQDNGGVYARLPNNIDPPKYTVNYSVMDVSGKQGNYGIRVGISGNSKELTRKEQSGFNNNTISIHLTYIV